MKKFVFMSLLLLMGCATVPSVPLNEETPEGLYLTAYGQFKEKDYEKAIENFDKVEQQFPYSQWSERAQIMMAYTQYLKNDYTASLLSLERFLQLHPGNRNVPYALYLKALCYYEQMSDPTREQEMTQKAEESFKAVLMRFPESVYAPDAREKLVMIQNYLAAKELSVGRYYQKNEDYIAAMNRFQETIDHWPESTQRPEAFYRLAACYKALGMNDQMNQVKEKLSKLYPDSVWNKRAKKL